MDLDARSQYRSTLQREKSSFISAKQYNDLYVRKLSRNASKRIQAEIEIVMVHANFPNYALDLFLFHLIEEGVSVVFPQGDRARLAPPMSGVLAPEAVSLEIEEGASRLCFGSKSEHVPLQSNYSRLEVYVKHGGDGGFGVDCISGLRSLEDEEATFGSSEGPDLQT
jgi:hypothetical protein